MGVILTFLEKLFNSNTNRLNLTIAFVFLTASLSMLKFHIGPVHIGFSSLLVCMMCGTVFCNLCDFSEELMERVDKWTAPLFVLFFVISGASLDLTVFKQPVFIVIGVIYILFRSLGKYYTGTPVTLTGKVTDGYAQVLLAGTTIGWLDVRFLTLDGQGFVPELPTVTIKNRGSGANLRSGPASAYSRLGCTVHPDFSRQFAKNVSWRKVDRTGAATDPEGDDHDFNMEVLEKGIDTLLEKAPDAFKDYINCNNDLCTGMNLIDCCIFGDVVYG